MIIIEEENMWPSEGKTFFRSATGSVRYLIRFTRLDITRSAMGWPNQVRRR